MADVSKINLQGTTYNFKDAEARRLIQELPSPMVFKGTLGEGGTIQALPEASAETVGHTYKVITAGTYAGQQAKVGDLFICRETSEGYEWTLVPSGDEPSGTVTNIATGSGLSGGPITTSGTISIDFNEVQSILTPGTGIAIEKDSEGRTLISNTQTSAEWGNITGTLRDQTDLKDELDDKQDVLTAGKGILISDDSEGNHVISINGSAIASFVYTITGDGSTTQFTVTHNFNSRDVMVQVYDLTSYDTVIADIIRDTLNTIKIDFKDAPASGKEFRVMISSTTIIEDGNSMKF